MLKIKKKGKKIVKNEKLKKIEKKMKNIKK